MNFKWKIIYYETSEAQCPVQDFIDGRKTRDEAKILSWISLLEEQGPNLPRPYADLLEDGIHELRVKLSGDQVRVLYFFCFREFIILTHAFLKNTTRVPKNQIRQAKRMREDFLNRFDEQQLKEETDENL
ncbi:MAG: type II toxin-antitoxin system RelE/ParE family toxin [Candidatus Latescibacteria bacterium]|nr:type II toxin-antitoxin system RelE/ParE family toxin [Candidatus Latescibacterota bacterium]